MSGFGHVPVLFTETIEMLCVKPDGVFHGVQLSPAHAIFYDVYELILYAALLEITFRFLCVKTFAFSEDLNIHSTFSIMFIMLLKNISLARLSG